MNPRRWLWTPVAAAALAAMAASARATPVRGIVTLALDSRASGTHHATYWRLDNGIVPIAPPSPDPRAEVVVLLEGGAASAASASPIPIEIRGYRLDPPIVFGGLGTTVQFRNADKLIHVPSTPASPTELSPAPIDPGQARTHKFGSLGAHSIRDLEFPHLQGWALIVDSGLVTRADPAGTFKIDAPPGRYTLKVFWRGEWLHERPIEVGPQPLDLDLKLTPTGSRGAGG